MATRLRRIIAFSKALRESHDMKVTGMEVSLQKQRASLLTATLLDRSNLYSNGVLR